jgi:glycosyltransferase involved in cell wall biosynthesis
MGDSLEVSVVIPTRDRWRFLRTAIRAAAGQQGVDHEVIVVDDGSRDGTAERVGAFDDPRIRLIRQGQSEGVTKARNRGIAEARGDWIAFLDDDDLWSPSKLRTQLAAATQVGAQWAYAEGILLDERGRIVKALQAPRPERLAESLLVANEMPAGSSNVIVRADLLRQLGGFDVRLAQIADWDLWIRLALAAPAAMSPEILVGWVGHSGSMLAADATEIVAEFEYVREKHGAAAAARGVEFSEARFMRFVAFGHRRAGKRLRAVQAYLRGRELGNVARALGALLGERAMSRARRIAGQPPPHAPSWLADYPDS